MRTSSWSRRLTFLGLAVLGTMLIAVFTWGVLGKHRYNQAARYVYKATRAVCPTPAYLPCDVPQAVQAAVSPASIGSERLVPTRTGSLTTSSIRLAPSRAPPAA